MKHEELEQLIRIITTEVLKAVAGSSPAEEENICDCARSEGETGGNNGVRFAGGVLAVADIDRLIEQGNSRVLLAAGTVVTPLARDVAAEKGITLSCSTDEDCNRQCSNGQAVKTVAVISGRKHKSQEQAVISAAKSTGYRTRLHPPSADRGDAILKAAIDCAGLLRRKELSRFVVLDENVYPLLFQLQRLEGIRPAVCWDTPSAIRSREANVLVLSNRQLGVPMLRKITEVWLEE